MGTSRDVEKLLSVFDLRVCKTSKIPRNATARILFVYDKKTNMKKFVIVNTDIPHHCVSRIIPWLEQNIGIDQLASGLKSNSLDVSWSQIALRLQPG